MIAMVGLGVSKFYIAHVIYFVVIDGFRHWGWKHGSRTPPSRNARLEGEIV